MTNEEILFKEAQLGIEAETFLSTDLGKYLLDKANNELEEGHNQLVLVSPEDIAKIINLQNQCKNAINFKSWILEAISNGNYAERELSNE